MFDSVVVALLHAAEVADPSGGHVIFTAVSISRHTLRNRVEVQCFSDFGLDNRSSETNFCEEMKPMV